MATAFQPERHIPDQLQDLGAPSYQYEIGLAHICAIGGQHCSSTRAEMFGAYNSLFLSVPVLFGMDSMSTLRKLRTLFETAVLTLHQADVNVRPGFLARLARRGLVPLRMVMCGSVFGWLYSPVALRVSRPPSSLSMLKRKRPLRHVKAEDKEGNDEADHFADKGVARHVAGLPKLADWFAGRHANYANLVDRIQMLIVKMALAEKEARERMQFEQYPSRTSTTARPTFLMPKTVEAATRDTRILKLMPPHKGTHKLSHPQQEAQALHAFLPSLVLTLPAASTPGISWIELFILFELRVGTLQKDLDMGDPKPRQILRDGRCKFKTLTRYIVDTTIQQREQLIYAAASPQTWASGAFACGKAGNFESYLVDQDEDDGEGAARAPCGHNSPAEVPSVIARCPTMEPHQVEHRSTSSAAATASTSVFYFHAAATTTSSLVHRWCCLLAHQAAAVHIGAGRLVHGQLFRRRGGQGRAECGPQASAWIDKSSSKCA